MCSNACSLALVPLMGEYFDLILVSKNLYFHLISVEIKYILPFVIGFKFMSLVHDFLNREFYENNKRS